MFPNNYYVHSNNYYLGWNFLSFQEILPYHNYTTMVIYCMHVKHDISCQISSDGKINFGPASVQKLLWKSMQ